MKNFSMIAKQFVSGKFVTDESGQDLIEYALVAAVVALGAVSALHTVSTAVASAFTSIGTSITSAI